MNKLTIYCDGGSRGNPGPAASAFIIYDQLGKILHQQGFFLGITTNNQAEYQAVIEALNWITHNQPTNNPLTFYLDSLLITNQIKGIYKIKNPELKDKYLLIKNKLDQLSKLGQLEINFNYIPRSQNSSADHLVNLTLDLRQNK